MFSLLQIVALLLTVTAVFAWINHQLLRLPNTIGLLVMGLLASLLLLGLELVFPQITLFHQLTAIVRSIDFSRTLLEGMLAFLLFAGALHVDISKLRGRRWVVGSMATIGVLISTITVAVAVWLASQMLGAPLPFVWALVFGALISPTDPVAVLSTLKAAAVPESLETDMTGESLLNDGVGVVLFTILLAAAVGMHGQGDFTIVQVGRLFFYEALGGAVLGLLAGYIAYHAMRQIDDYGIEVLISLALVTGSYALASSLHLSGPIAVVVAGLLIGNRGTSHAMSETTRGYLYGFWTLIDEILNSVLFLLIGLEVLVLQFDLGNMWLAAAVIPIALVARLFAVAIPVLALNSVAHFVPGTIPVLTWGGIRGGISIALALSLPDVPERAGILAATYAVAVFSIVVQGLTLSYVARKLASEAAGPSDKPPRSMLR
jgi:CPA1 family monovalent cation:H+ antiporter